MYVFLCSRPRLLQITSVPVKRFESLQRFSQKLDTGDKRTEPEEKPFSDIPGPPSLPIIGNLLDYYRGLYDLRKPYETYSLFLKKYGPLVKENLFYGKTLVHVFHQRDMARVYGSERGSRPIRHSHTAIKKYRESRKDLYYNIGVAASNGEEWYRYRMIYDLFPLQLRDRPTVHPSIEEIADDLIKYMKSNLDHNGEIPVFPSLYYYTLEVIGMLILGKRMGCFDLNSRADVTRFIEAVHESHYAIHETELKPYILSRKAYKILALSQDYIAHFVLKHMNYIEGRIEFGNRNTDPFTKSTNSDDLVINVEDSDPARIADSFLYLMLKQGLSEGMILPMAVDFFQGGIHSTANTLAFAIYHLAMNQDKQQILREDLVKSFPDKSEKIVKILRRARYVPKVVIETLRLNPPTIGTGRVLNKDLILSGYQVPKGTQVILHHEVATKSEEYYPDPLKFIPERDSTPIVYNPFIDSSRRICMGKIIALAEMQMALIKIFRHFEVSYHYEKVGVVNYLVNEPDRPIKLRLKEIS